MAKKYLDPNDTEEYGEWRPDRSLPRSVRHFGRYPNFDEWRPGSLLLFHVPEKTPLVSRLIIKAQEGAYYHQHARWHHAAVYVGGGFLCEAHVRGGVQYRPLDNYIGKHWIRVRCDDRMSESQGYELAIRAMTRLRESYGFSEILKLSWLAIKGFPARSPLALAPKGAICSHLYDMAYRGVTKRMLYDTGDRPIMPAELSMTDELKDVPVCWRRIARG
jgi:hypothetical protein